MANDDFPKLESFSLQFSNGDQQPVPSPSSTSSGHTSNIIRLHPPLPIQSIPPHMGFPPFRLLLVLSFWFAASSPPSPVQSQQPYIGLFTTDCNNQHNSSSGLGYFCNGAARSCPAYLTFNAQPSYQSVSALASLLGAEPSQVALANGVDQGAVFPAGRMVLVPVNCSCSGAFYQAPSSPYLVRSDETYMTIANTRFQGLSTCQALQDQSPPSVNGFLLAGINITVPLRCACPTRNQTSNGVRYLLSYVVDEGNFVDSISSAFGVATKVILDANELPSVSPNIYPNTTLLVPLRDEPNASQLSNPPPPPPPPPPSAPSGESSNRTGLYVGIGVAAAACVLIASLGFFCVIYRRKRKRDDREAAVDIADASELYKSLDEKNKGGLTEDILSSISDIAPSLKVYKFGELRLATEDFCAECRIEGSVYRAMLNGDAAAVKKMNRDVSEEISILNRINHVNLIGLSGVCFNEGTWYLVYEYMENGSLSSWIYGGNDDSKVLSWIQRLQIGLDVANGLHYLHSYADPPHVHKDIRSSNILLDGQLRAKIANFSLARPSEGGDGEFVLTRHIVGTVGYMAPEYLEHGLISPKLDVYALGVVMLELLTGREAAATLKGGDLILMEKLVSLISKEDQSEKLGSFMDPLLEGECPLDLALIMAKLIAECLKKDPGSRPSSEEVAHSLSRILAASLAWELSRSQSGSQSF